MDAIEQTFQELLTERGLQLTERQLSQFSIYYRELVSWNEKMNLTGITEREQVYIKHFYDSASLSFYVPVESGMKVADIGSGAGFPSIPLKILFPDIRVTIIDSLNKRIQFLTHLCSELELDGVDCVHGRAEDMGWKSEYRDQFDLVTARAVARMNVLNEFCLPFVRNKGLFAAMKGSDPTDELREAGRSLKELKAELQAVNHMTLPVEQSERHIILIRKLGATPSKYPRKPGVPLKTPLV